MNEIQQFSQQLVSHVEQVIVGKRSVIELVTVALLCEGHVLLEDVPGTGKTMLGRALAISLGGSFKRLQCTPDLLPNDVTGVSVFNQGQADFEFRPGPVFVNILLADEINRATPRTQSALLEAMQEQQVTVDGVTRPLPRPFLVLATQNPIEYEGTFPLPEAQLDRFLMRLPLGYPSPADERQILLNLRREHPIASLQPLAFDLDGGSLSGVEALLRLQRQVWEVHVDSSLEDYLLRLVGATRQHPELALGASPRASLALLRAAQALAAVRGRDHVLPDDIKYLTPVVLPHRLLARPEAELRGRTAGLVLADLLNSLPLELDAPAP
ncbi:MAG TPA: MoxR family ATPase [Anaerolineales bacterium]|nr:MoxR family ATPase [Anaerolineales bacterium]